MDYRKLGKTGLNISPICIGGWQLAGPLAFDGKPDGHPDPGRENVLRLIRELGDRGVNCIDTAEQYGNGESERRIGEAINGHRDQWIVSTKFGYRIAPDGSREDDSGPTTIMPSLEGSLKRLRTGYVDIYLFHCNPEVHDLDASREILEKAKQAGKIRYYGISTKDFELIKVLYEHSMLDVIQYHANTLEPRPDIYNFASEHNIGTQIRGVMAQGRLSGKYFRKKQMWREDDNRSNWFKNANFQKYSVFENAVPQGMTMAQVAIRWALDQNGNHTICMGAKNLVDYEAAIQAAQMPPLPEQTKQKLNNYATLLA